MIDDEEIIEAGGDDSCNNETVSSTNLLNLSVLSNSSSDASHMELSSFHGTPSRCKWSERDDLILKRAVNECKAKNWKKIAAYLDGKTDVQCLHRWQKVLKPGLVKGSWGKEEDQKLMDLVERYGLQSWSAIALHIEGRLGKQCRERWFNHLDPKIIRTPFTYQDDDMILHMHQKLGNHWSEIARQMPGRTDNAIKNRWNATLCKRVKKIAAASTENGTAHTPPRNTNSSSSSSSSIHAAADCADFSTASPHIYRRPALDSNKDLTNDSFIQGLRLKSSSKRAKSVLLPSSCSIFTPSRNNNNMSSGLVGSVLYSVVDKRGIRIPLTDPVRGGLTRNARDKLVARAIKILGMK